MKIDDLKFDLVAPPVDEENFDLDRWRKESPMDYWKALYMILHVDSFCKGIPIDEARWVAFESIYRVTRLYIPNTLYKYYSLNDIIALNETKLQTLQDCQIYMSDIKDFNDPFDGKAFFYNPDELKHIDRLSAHEGRLIDDFTSFNKGTAFTENGVNCMPMWAHYSNNHRGFCVAYDMKDPNNNAMYSCTFPIQYTNERLDITSLMKKYAQTLVDEMKRQTSEGKKQIEITDYSLIYISTYLSNIKHISWQYEKEFRCMMGATAKGMPYVKAVPKAIYIGMRCMQTYEERLRKIGALLQIPVHKMSFDDCSEEFNLKVSE